MSRASRATLCGAGGLFQHPAKSLGLPVSLAQPAMASLYVMEVYGSDGEMVGVNLNVVTCVAIGEVRRATR